VSMNRKLSSVGITVCLLAILVAFAAARLLSMPAIAVAGVVVGIYFLFAIVVVDQWEKVAVLRFGRYRGLRGPGLVLIIPIVETLSRYVDQRVRVTTVSAESTLTRDTVPVNVDAIIFWLVWNAEKSILGRLYAGHYAELADGSARVDWAPSVGADDHRTRDSRPRTAEDSR